MKSHPIRGTEDLSRNRLSRAGERYFLTLCTHDRQPALTRADVWDTMSKNTAAMESDDSAQTLALVLMPDHLHWLIRLGHRLSLASVIARFKAKGRPAGHRGDFWQRGFFDHRLVEDEEAEPYARYMFLNPWRAGLAAAPAPWPYWHAGNRIRWNFITALSATGCPPASWIKETARPFGMSQGGASSAPTTDLESGRETRS